MLRFRDDYNPPTSCDCALGIGTHGLQPVGAKVSTGVIVAGDDGVQALGRRESPNNMAVMVSFVRITSLLDIRRRVRRQEQEVA
jgi:hypothetical protein